MKTISYRQYYYGGDYSDKKRELPDLSGIYEVYATISHRVKDQEGEVWSKSYIITSAEKFKDSRLIGNIHFKHLDDVFITESDLSVFDIEFLSAKYAISKLNKNIGINLRIGNLLSVT